MELLAQAVSTPSTTWGEILAGIAVIMATATGGVMVKDRFSAKRRAADSSDGVSREVCEAKHQALDRRFDDLKETVEKGFDRIQQSLDRR